MPTSFLMQCPCTVPRAWLTPLRIDAIRSASKARPFLRLMATRACEFQSPVGWLGRWRLERDRIDLKKGGIMPCFLGRQDNRA